MNQALSALARPIKRYPLTSFFSIAIVLGWLFSLIAVRTPALFILVAIALSYLPALLALIVLRVAGSAEERQHFAMRLRTWRVGLGWWLIALLLMPIFHWLAIGIGVLFLGGKFPLHSSNIVLVPVILFVNWGEELAWRGFALPRLQTRFNSLLAGLILGGLWAIVHLVIWTIGDPPILPRMMFATLFIILLSVILTWLFNQTQSSLPVATLLHASTDTLFNLISPLAETQNQLAVWAIEVGLMLLFVVALVRLYGSDLGRK